MSPCCQLRQGYCQIRQGYCQIRQGYCQIGQYTEQVVTRRKSEICILDWKARHKWKGLTSAHLACEDREVWSLLSRLSTVSQLRDYSIGGLSHVKHYLIITPPLFQYCNTVDFMLLISLWKNESPN